MLERIGAEPDEVAEQDAEAVRQDRFRVFTHQGSMKWVEARQRSLRGPGDTATASLDTTPAHG